MRTVFAVKFLVIFLVNLPFVCWAETKIISLEQAVSIALNENLEIKTSEREIEAAEARLSRTKSYFLPKIGAESRYEFIESTYQRQRGGTGNLFLEWNVFNGFRDSYDRKAKYFEFDQSKTASERQKIFTKAEVEAKFYKLLAVRESINSYEDALKRNDVQEESAKRRKSAGLASEADVLEFDIYQTELNAEKAKLNSELQQAQAEFREVLGQTNSAIEYVPQGQLTHFHIDESLEQLKARAPKESQNLIAARFAVERAEANKMVAAGGYLPQLDIKATYGSRGINETAVAPETAIMGVARWEFFSGLDTYNARNEASAFAGQAEAHLRKSELSTNVLVESAFSRLKTIQDRVDAEAENIVKAKKFFDVVANEYKRGVKNSADMRAASQLFLQVILSDVRHRAEFFEQKAILEKAIGGSLKVSKGSVTHKSE